MVRELTHSKLLESLADFFPSLCTIEANDPTQSDSGAPVEGTAVEVYTDIPCSIASQSAREPRTRTMTYEKNQFWIVLRGYYPLVKTEMKAVVELVFYNILGVEFDSHKVTTRLTVELVQ